VGSTIVSYEVSTVPSSAAENELPTVFESPYVSYILILILILNSRDIYMYTLLKLTVLARIL